MKNPTTKKTQLFTRILPALKDRTAYFSLAAVKRALTAAEIELADDTLREYMSEAMASGIVSDGWRKNGKSWEMPIRFCWSGRYMPLHYLGIWRKAVLSYWRAMPTQEVLAAATIEVEELSRFISLKSSVTEAFWYWYQASQ